VPGWEKPTRRQQQQEQQEQGARDQELRRGKNKRTGEMRAIFSELN
jgi:hypothetical protein